MPTFFADFQRSIQQDAARTGKTITIALNVTAVTRLASAIAPRLVQTGSGAIVNIGSVVGLGPEFRSTLYGATKAFVLFLSQSLHAELGPKGVYVQAVLPAATRTELWARLVLLLASKVANGESERAPRSCFVRASRNGVRA